MMRRPLDEPGVAEVLDENFVDERVLRQRLNHQHPLVAQQPEDFWDGQHLKQSRILHNAHSQMNKC